MRRIYTVLTALIFAFCVPVVVNGAVAEEIDKAQVMMLGVFHFANPGLDVVKTDQMNVMADENQAYLDAFAERLAAFAPTHVLIECDPEYNQTYNTRLSQYLQGSFDLPSNENYQIGFRTAKLAGLTSVVCYNEANVGWESGPLYDYMPEKAPAIKAEQDALIAEIVAETTEDHKTKSLKDLLIKNNAAEVDSINKYFYVMTNEVGAGDTFVGADAAASWWHRNFRMYANVQKYAQKGARVLVVGGQGHTAILKDLLALDKKRIAVDVMPYF